jgi:hypothetical protein
VKAFSSSKNHSAGVNVTTIRQFSCNRQISLYNFNGHYYKYIGTENLYAKVPISVQYSVHHVSS